MLQKLFYNFLIAADSITQNKVRALLTSLGIIFGVASVIAMLAIGKGAEQEILEQIKILGANNVIVRPVVEQEEGPVEDESVSTLQPEKRPYSPGLTLSDARSIRQIIPGVTAVSPEVIVETEAVRAGYRRTTKLVGVGKPYFATERVHLAEGRFFTDTQLEKAEPVAVIGAKVKTRFFAQEEAIGNRIKCGPIWLTVVGVLEERALSKKDIEDLGIRDYNYDIYTPINTMLLRYTNRAEVTERDVEAAAQSEEDDETTTNQRPVNYHQLDRLVVHVRQSDLMQPVSEVMSRMLRRRHNDVVDYEVVIPEQLLEQERRTQTIFNIVLAAIASISLIVGGIGIMNIMLASVMERIREIGVRRSVGATQHDIIQQFLIEALALSFTGGLLGIMLGASLSYGIEVTTGIATVVTVEAVLLAFVVSAGVGLVFGLWPAKRAAEHDPVVALRHE